MCGWWKCAGSMFRMFRAKARPALCGSYGSACSGGRPARLLAAHVDLLADLGDDVAVAVDDVGLEPVQAFVAVGGGAADVVEHLVAEVELRPHRAAPGLDELDRGRLVPDDAAVAQRLHGHDHPERSEEHTSDLQSLMRTSYAVFCLKKNKTKTQIS